MKQLQRMRQPMVLPMGEETLICLRSSSILRHSEIIILLFMNVYKFDQNQRIQMQQPKYFFKFTDSFNDGGTVWYTIQVHSRGEEQEPIIFKSRYSEMRQIHEKCAATQYKNDLPDFPQKKFINSTKEEFIQKRKKELENYYNTLAKTMDIDKLKDLSRFIESHRKVKKSAPKPNKGMDETTKIEAKIKKDNQLRTGFELIYKEVLDELIDISDEFYPVAPEDLSKRYNSQLLKIKPLDSQLLACEVEGLEENDGDFWSMFFRDDHENLLTTSDLIVEHVRGIEGEMRKAHKVQNFVIAK